MLEIKDLLLKNKEQQHELEIFLTHYFNSSQQNQNQNEISHGEGKCIVKYNKGNEIKSILIDEDIVAKADLINEVVVALSTNSGLEVSSRFVFSSVNIDGYFRYKNAFQISPVPDNAPRLDLNLVESDHPFNVEFSFLKSPDLSINSYRAEKKFTEISLLLNSLLRLGLNNIKSNSVQVWTWDIVGGIPKCKYLYTGYFLEELDMRSKDSNGFTSFIESEKIPQKNSAEYYSTKGISSGDYRIIIPDNFTDSIDKYYELSDDNKEKFLRSSYWLQTAFAIFQVSKSVAYNALVTSIEVFLDVDIKCNTCRSPTSSDKCSECSQPNSGPTKKFKDFVDQFAPGTLESLRKELYDIRSNITHGSMLLPGDGPESSRVFNPERNNSSHKWYLLSQISRTIQINWLYFNNTSSTVEILR